MKKISRIFFCILALALVATCFAACGEAVFTVTYKVGDNESVTVRVAESEKAVPLAVECEPGIYVEGWYTDNSLTEADRYDFTTPITGDITLYPKYAAETKTYAYEYILGCEGISPEGGSIDRDGMLTLADVPIRVGYEFLGWTDGSKTYKAGDTYSLEKNSDVMFFALWEYKTVSIEFYDFAGRQVGETVEVPYGSTVSQPDEVPGELFCFVQTDWRSEDGETFDLKCVVRDMQLHAIYSYESTDTEYFNFTLNEDRVSYSVGIKPQFTQNFLEFNVALPEEHMNLPVTKISVGGLGLSGTFDCAYIPSSIKYVGDSAFSFSGFRKLYFAEGVEVFGNAVFSNMKLLKELHLPASLHTVGQKIFSDVSASMTVHVAENANFKYVDDSLRSADGKIIYEVVDTGFSRYEIGAEVEEIYPALFYDMLELQSVVVNANLDLLQPSTFSNCRNLRSVTFNGAIGEIGGFRESEWSGDYGDSAYTSSWDYGAFNNCYELTSLTFKSGLKRIGNAAFSGCVKLHKISLPNTVETIVETAFFIEREDLENLWSEIEVTGDAKTDAGKIYTDGFGLFVRGAGVEYNGVKGDKMFIFTCAPASCPETYEVPEGVTAFEYGVFRFAILLQSLIIPEGVTEITPNLFAGCLNLTDLRLPSTLTTITSKMPERYGSWTYTNVKYDPFYAFGNLQMMEMPQNENVTLDLSATSLVSIDDGCFQDVAIKKLILPASFKTLGISTFSNEFGTATLEVIEVSASNPYFTAVDGILYNKDKSILVRYPTAKSGTTFTVPAHVLEIGEFAFAYNATLKEIVFLDGLETFGRYAFLQAKGITSFDLPASIKRVGSFAFNTTNNASWGSEVVELTFSSELAPVFGTQFVNIEQGKSIINVPKEYFHNYYFYLEDAACLNINYDALDKFTISFVNNQGDNPNDLEVCVVVKLPTPESNDVNLGFQGWWTRDGREDGDWGEHVVSPFVSVEPTITVYAKWGFAPLRDGSDMDFAVELYPSIKIYAFVRNGHFWIKMLPNEKKNWAIYLCDLLIDNYAEYSVFAFDEDGNGINKFDREDPFYIRFTIENIPEYTQCWFLLDEAGLEF